LFQYTVRGIPFTYYGEELGMPQSELPFKEAKDAIAHRFSPFAQKLAKLAGQTLNRDECRTPMHWNSSAHAGFTEPSAKPWLPLSPHYKIMNVETQQNDDNSLLIFYKKIIALRNKIAALQSGSLKIADDYCSRKVFAFYRVLNDEMYLTLLNMSKRKVKLPCKKGTVLLSTHQETESNFLQPYEGRLVKAEK
jgi:glycosidase